MRRASRGRRLQLGIAAAVLAASILAVWAYLRPAPASAPGPIAANHYIDSVICSNCHGAIAESFRKTGMGRSFSRILPQNALENFTSAKPFYHRASDTYFSMIQRGGETFQRRWQIGFDGKETNLEE